MGSLKSEQTFVFLQLLAGNQLVENLGRSSNPPDTHVMLRNLATALKVYWLPNLVQTYNWYSVPKSAFPLSKGENFGLNCRKLPAETKFISCSHWQYWW